ncbi:MAG: DUF3226 domain-containing protein [Lachnospirales bacterium]
MNNYVFFVEGNQDVAMLYRVLTDFLGFTEIKSYKKIENNIIFAKKVKTKFPFKKNSLNIFNEIPMFFEKGDKQICVINANGEANLLYKLDTFYDIQDNNEFESIEKFIIFADGDLKTKDEKIEELKTYIQPKEKNRKLKYIKENSFKNDCLEFNVHGVDVQANLFIFPNNNDKGRLENILIENLKNNYSCLHKETILHFENLEKNCNIQWADTNSDRNKALVGCIGNIIIPSASNVTLISNKDFQWIDKENISKDLKILIDFLKGMLGESDETNI